MSSEAKLKEVTKHISKANIPSVKEKIYCEMSQWGYLGMEKWNS